MGVMETVGRLLSLVRTKADTPAEGSVRAGPWNLPVTGGLLTPDYPGYGQYWNWWQLGGKISGGSSMAMVEACVSAYAQTVAMCPGGHWKKLDNGGRERIKNSDLSRILRRPNEYQTPSDFMLNLTRSLYIDGNAYCLALRNNRYEVDSLHLMDPKQSGPAVYANEEEDDEDGAEIVYHLGGNSVIDHRRLGLLDSGVRLPEPTFVGGGRLSDRLNKRGGSLQQLLVPGRDVLHVRLHSVDKNEWPFPLIGDTPLSAAMGDIATYEKIKNQQDQFFQNQARPSAVLTTDLALDKDQMDALRQRWNEQSKGLHAGGVPILSHGLKVMPWTQAAPSKDLQIAELLKLAMDHIALVYRVPLAVLGVQGASGGTTEQLMGFWLASGLGFCLNHIEDTFDRFFGLRGQPDEYTEFDTEALLRTARKERVEYLVRGVQGGIFSPNEARAHEDLPAVEYGEEPRVQQQVVPLSAAAAIPEAPEGAGTATPGSPGTPGAGGQPSKEPLIPGPGATPPAPAAAGPKLETPSSQKVLVLRPKRRPNPLEMSKDEFARRYERARRRAARRPERGL